MTAIPMIQFTVHGEAQPAGSKRGFVNKKTGRVIITDAAKQSRPWKALVSDAAVQAMLVTDGESRILGVRPPLEGPLLLELVFWVQRPKSHRGKLGLLPSAPRFPTVRPDVLKLARAVEDALTGIVYRDDAQIVSERLVKHYGEPARVEIVLIPLDRPSGAAKEEPE